MPRAARCSISASVRAANRAVLGLAALAALAACGHPSAIETGLNKDFALADQLQRANAPSLVSSQELTPAPAAEPVVAAATRAPATHAPAVQTRVNVRRITRTAVAPASVRTVAGPASTRPRPVGTGDRTVGGEVIADATTDRAGGAREGSYDPGATITSETSSYPTTAAPATSSAAAPVYRQSHTARDGVLGALAGAILGAATNRTDRVRGGAIGAVAGGALGAIYGGSVDRTTYAGVPSSPTYRSSTGYRVTPRYRGTI